MCNTVYLLEHTDTHVWKASFVLYNSVYLILELTFNVNMAITIKLYNQNGMNVTKIRVCNRLCTFDPAV